jgi:replication factor C subunit 1
LKKIEELKLNVLNEDEFYDLINSTGQNLSHSAGKIVPTVAAKQRTPPRIKAEQTITSEKESKNIAGKTSKVSGSDIQLWTEKYKPVRPSELIGNKGMADKLEIWLKSWNESLKNGFKKGDFRAALLSGPPGIGKTTTAHMVSHLAGYDVIEFNASDTRNKKSIQVYFFHAECRERNYTIG